MLRRDVAFKPAAIDHAASSPKTPGPGGAETDCTALHVANLRLASALAGGADGA